MTILTLITQIFLFSLVGNIHNENYFSINLSVEETRKQSVLINVLIYNNSSRTIAIHSLRKECDNINVNFPWEIIIKHDENKYEYPITVTGAGKFVKVKRRRSYHFVMCIDFAKLVKIDNNTCNSFTEETVNTDYGDYEIILSYPNPNGQTITSNLLKTTYKR